MSIVGVFNKTRPQIRGIYFDAVLEEASELRTDVSEYPLDNGATANDNAVTRPLTLIMTVAVSDNPVKTLMANAGQFSTIAGMGAGAAVGLGSSFLPGAAAAAVGVAASVGLSFVPASLKRSTNTLDELRWSQRHHEVMTVIDASGKSYDNMIITNTRNQRTKANEGGLELVVEMRQLNIKNRKSLTATTNSNLPANDTIATQGQTQINIGQVTPQ
ncbi:MAG: phage baseplate protein [Dickeya sp.]